MFVRSPYNYDRNAVSDETGLFCDPESDEGRSKAVQSEREEADINTLVRRFGITGQLPQNVRVPTYSDFTDVFDFQTAMNAILAAEQSFMSMPADVRSRFHNDPQEFLEFCQHETDGKLTNLEEMRKLGLAVPEPPAPEPVKPIEVVVVGGEHGKVST